MVHEWRSEDNLRELMFTVWVSGNKLRFSGLVSSAFIHWAICVPLLFNFWGKALHFFFQNHMPGQRDPLMTGRGSAVQFGVLYCFHLLVPPVWHWIRFLGCSNKQVSSWFHTCVARKCLRLSIQRPFSQEACTEANGCQSSLFSGRQPVVTMP